MFDLRTENSFIDGVTDSMASLLRRFDWGEQLTVDAGQHRAMRAAQQVLERLIRDGREVYGITTGFGPNVSYPASRSGVDQGLGLISHLGAGQGPPFAPSTTRLMVGLRLVGMARGHSGITPEAWRELASRWNLGYTPVVPSLGSVSASGDLIPLAHAALSMAGDGEAWSRQEAGWSRGDAALVLHELGLAPLPWSAREALAFVNGTSATLAVTLQNHWRILRLARASAVITGKLVGLLNASTEPYLPEVAQVHGSAGQATAAQWIREEVMVNRVGGTGRSLQEPYSLRCAPQVLGAVLDHLGALGEILLAEANGCSDNPVVTDGDVVHAGNFHAVGVGLCSDAHALLVHQVALLAERQLALILDPASNGGRPPLLTPHPGPCSGLAGLQLTATSLVSRIRQLGHPSSLTSLPTNLNNQDIVPNALSGATTVAELAELAELVLGSLAIATTQLGHLDGVSHIQGSLLDELTEIMPPLSVDRPLHEETRRCWQAVRQHSQALLPPAGACAA